MSSNPVPPPSLKRIAAARVLPGMYVQRIEGKWLDHPFWRNSFLVEEGETLSTLHALGQHGVWIDTSRGRDVAVEPAATPSPPPARPAAPPEPPQTGFGQDYIAAEAVRERARGVARSLFREARMGQALSMDAAGEVIDEVTAAITRNSAAMLSVVRLKNKDDYTYLHSVAVGALMIALGKRLGYEGAALRELGMAGLLHDIGKVGIDDAVLNKPGRLSPLEMATVRQHPQIGWDILRREAAAGKMAMDVCLNHHEKTDGSGYPGRLSGEAISEVARMGAICDVYDAITSDRPYKRGWEPAEAIRRMAEWQEGHFDRRLFHAFVKMIGIYPTGTLVRLASDRIAVVLVQGKGSALMPIVQLVCTVADRRPLSPDPLDLEGSDDRIVAIEDPLAWDLDVTRLLRA
ncbi:MAG: HD-GYP domain-containing protein [Xanthomonadaceae bacterium]|nr:HD-GYP domain-containing protein [Xanthomonadaceae bacterium]MDE1965312.1 HD-GYP domain-containing protein [Xanthomonadaceae bacterium]